VRAGSARNGLVSFLVEMPYAGPDYRLDSLTLEFRSEAPAPTITLEASSGSLTENIRFHRLDGDRTRLAIPDTGQSGDGTVLLEFWRPPTPSGRTASGSTPNSGSASVMQQRAW